MKLNIRIEGQTFAVEVGDLSVRPIQVVVDGTAFDVWPEEEGAAGEFIPTPKFDQHVAPPPLPEPVNGEKVAGESINKTRSVVAPIPGVMVTINVKEGDQVAFGQELCVLEAMKMKNLIRANRAGTIGAVRVAVGDQVRQNQVLVEYTE